MDTLDGMKAFAAVAETGSFTEAARHLRLSRALVSKYVARLEDRLGARLLSRTTRTVSLTEIGHSYREHCITILDQVEQAEAAAACGQVEPGGLLRISAPRTFGERHLVAAVADFIAAHPRVEVAIDFNDRFVNLIEEGYDAAIRIGRLADSSLIARRLTGIPIHVVASPAYLEAAGRPRRPEDLAGHQCIIDTNLVHDRRWTFTDGDRRIDVTVSGRIATNSAEAVWNFARADAGIARIPDFEIGPEIAQGRLVILLEDFSSPPIAAYAVYPQGRFVPAKTRAFVDHLGAWFSGRAGSASQRRQSAEEAV
jgi:DNA-binding transcriptional LysR family regulator